MVPIREEFGVRDPGPTRKNSKIGGRVLVSGRGYVIWGENYTGFSYPISADQVGVYFFVCRLLNAVEDEKVVASSRSVVYSLSDDVLLFREETGILQSP